MVWFTDVSVDQSEMESQDFYFDRIEIWQLYIHVGFPDDSDGKESACNVGDLVSMSELGRSPWGGHGDPFQYSFLENAHGQRNLRATVPGITKSWTWLTD